MSLLAYNLKRKSYAKNFIVVLSIVNLKGVITKILIVSWITSSDIATQFASRFSKYALDPINKFKTQPNFTFTKQML